MRKLSLTLVLVLAIPTVSLMAQSPHGDKFKVSCNTCHNTNGWELDEENYTFNHDQTDWPLEGGHRETNCRSCHPSLVFDEAETACSGCHTDMHENTTGPDCERCHTPRSWIVENITALHRQSRFPLVGPHVTAECIACHKSASLLRFEPLGVACMDCHQSDYYGATEPNHVQSGYSTDCITCHSINSFSWNWVGTELDHAFFPLTAGHASKDCNQCHVSGSYSGLSSECYACHRENYDQAVNPNHSAAHFPTDCNYCHTTDPGWSPANFDHTTFPLTSGHAITDCNRCHPNGNYTGTSAECFSCHQADYNQTTNPDHVQANIPTACNNCHTTDPGWKPARFAIHDAYFPVYTGSHQGQWNSCTECHPNSNYATFTCTDCHEHNQTDMNDEHKEVNGYTWTSTACLQCHPTGKADD